MTATPAELRCLRMAVEAFQLQQRKELDTYLQGRRWWRAAMLWVQTLSPPILEPAAILSPLTGRIEDLWRAAESWVRPLDRDASMELLSRWVFVLYGKDVSATALRDRYEALIRSRIRANLAWYRGDPNAAHFHFNDPILSLAADLSEELGLYGDDRAPSDKRAANR
ncbi:MAG: hypothetical protein V2I45_10355 [Halieaceae bacterium]|nr:hypothetical protein [Halieaceae bacterium]